MKRKRKQTKVTPGSVYPYGRYHFYSLCSPSHSDNPRIHVPFPHPEIYSLMLLKKDGRRKG
jgi:hypothetical protein